METLEFKDFIEKSEKLAKVNDLWYFIKSSSGAWIVGSGN